MPLSYRIFPTIDLVYIKHCGVIDLGQLVESFKKYTADEAFRPTQRQLVDLRNLEGAMTGFWEMDEFGKIFGKSFEAWSRPVPVSVVTGSAFSERLAWMYGRVVKDETTVKLGIFHDIDSALKNLSIDKCEFDTLLEQEHKGTVVDLFPDQSSRR